MSGRSVAEPFARRFQLRDHAFPRLVVERIRRRLAVAHDALGFDAHEDIRTSPSRRARLMRKARRGCSSRVDHGDRAFRSGVRKESDFTSGGILKA